MNSNHDCLYSKLQAPISFETTWTITCEKRQVHVQHLWFWKHLSHISSKTHGQSQQGNWSQVKKSGPLKISHVFFHLQNNEIPTAGMLIIWESIKLKENDICSSCQNYKIFFQERFNHMVDQRQNYMKWNIVLPVGKIPSKSLEESDWSCTSMCGRLGPSKAVCDILSFSLKACSGRAYR